MWCNGWSPDWSGSHTFTAAECTAKSGATWACDTGGAPTYAGIVSTKARPVPMIDDGRNRTAKWAPLKVSGAVKNVRPTGTVLKVGKDSTPYRKNLNAFDALQPYTVTAAAKGADVTAWDINWQTAGMPGKAWNAARTVKFTGDFTVTSVRVDSIDLATGRPAYSKTTSTQRLDASCTSAPVYVALNRARISN